MSSPRHILVIGAGVIGLSTALKLQQAGYSVAIVAEYFPTDPKHIKYTSCWAGAHHVSVAGAGDLRMHEFDKETFGVMANLLADDPDAPLMMRPQVEYREFERALVDGVDQLTLLSLYSPDFRMLDPSELPSGITHGCSFTTLMINTPEYLAYLLTKFIAAGGTTYRAQLASLAAASELESRAVALVNCTGLGARTLVDDKGVFPTRGQLVVVRAPWIEGGVMRLGPKGSGIYTYTIPRQGGNVVIGGTADANDWDPIPRPETARLIKERGIALCPELLPPDKRSAGRIEDLDVVEECVGLRPTRIGGIRIEMGMVEVKDGQLPVLHHYGHGGYGFQTSWGSARAAVELLQASLA